MSHPTVGFSADADATELLRISRSAGGAAFQRPGAAAALAAELHSAGLTDTQLSRLTVMAPGRQSGGPPAPCRCTNVHTRVRAPRGDGLESLALVTPLAFAPQRPDPAYDGRNQSAEGAELALMAAAGLVLHMARGHVAGGSESGSGFGSTSDGHGGGRWLTRDLLWVVPDLSCGGYQCLEAWVRQYHGDATAGTAVRQEANASASSLPPSPIGMGAAMVRGGVIQQAVVLEALAGASYDTSELLVMGHDGLLPKLDMFYLLRYLFNYPVAAALWRDELLEGPTKSLTARLMGLLPEGLMAPQALGSSVRRLLAGLQFSWHQAVGQPAGPHAAFKNFMVDAATVRLTSRQKRSPDSAFASRYEQQRQQQQQQQLLQQRALSLSYCLELTLRSLNNLVERVHHSPFLYVLTDTDRYVSVERYVGPAVALTAALQLQAAWSMAAAQRALEAALAPAAAAAAAAATTAAVTAALRPASQLRIWAAAAARAAARTAVLAVAAAGLRAVACGCPSWLRGESAVAAAAAAASGSGGAAVPPWVAACAAALRSAVALPLATPEGLLAVGALLVGGGAAAVAAAGLAGVLAGGAAWGEWSGVGDRKPAAAAAEAAEARTPKRSAAERSAAAEARAVKAVCGGLAATPAAAGVQGELASGKEAGQSDCEGQKAAFASAALRTAAAAAAWHAERVVVLTATAVAMTALVCLNWAAALVAGMYLAPLALWQGWAAGRWATPSPQTAGGRRGDAGGVSAGGARGRMLRKRLVCVLLRAVWTAWNPLVYLVLVYTGAAAVGFVRPMPVLHGTAAGAVCALSATNFWYAGVVAASLWLFGGGSMLT